MQDPFYECVLLEIICEEQLARIVPQWCIKLLIICLFLNGKSKGKRAHCQNPQCIQVKKKKRKCRKQKENKTKKTPYVVYNS